MTEVPAVTARYFPEIFNVKDLPHARDVILTGEGSGADTDTRWERETPYVLELVREQVALGPRTLVLDYGCGIGRIAKAMIEATGCAVIGVDISPGMRALAVDYVASDRFVVVSPGQYDLLVGAGLRVQAAIAIWVLQHCFAPADDIARIGRGLGADGRLFVLNMPKRAVPAVRDGKSFFWAWDGIDVGALLRSAFNVEAAGSPDAARTPNMADAGAFWMALRPSGQISSGR